MPSSALSVEAERAVSAIQKADIVIGIPSFNNARTIGHVVRACYAGVSKYYPQMTSVVINSDGGSTDGTREAVLSTSVDEHSLMLLSTPLYPVHRLSAPYHGIPGKGSAFRMVFEMAQRLGARACVVVDSDLRSITPEWIDLLLRPILLSNYEFVAPYYHRHKYDGTITNSIVYPLTRMLYGAQVRQPIGGDFGVSSKLIDCYLEKDVWETDVARFGIDIWMTTVAIAEGFRVCQSFLGAKLHDAKDPGLDLSAMLQQVVSSIFELMGAYEATWRRRNGSIQVPLFGFRFDVGLDPISVDVDRMLREFQRGARELDEIWGIALRPDTLAQIQQAAQTRVPDGSFHLDDKLWARVILEFSWAYRTNRLARSQLLASLAPLYLGRVASFVEDTRMMGSAEVEGRIEDLCRAFEELKPYLSALWRGDTSQDSLEVNHV
jgi:glycosyltransferase involved in cell wall biosynthesis